MWHSLYDLLLSFSWEIYLCVKMCVVLIKSEIQIHILQGQLDERPLHRFYPYIQNSY
jgi:hypothetical protein